MLRLGDIAPDFEANSSEGKIRFHDWIRDSWVVLFSHPKDFTPVCTTELGFMASLEDEFKKRNVKIIALSTSSLSDHDKWLDDIEKTQGHKIRYPLIDDADRKISELYGMIHPNHDEVFTVRTVFIIDAAKKVRLMLAYPQTTGRNFEEILRTIDSMQLTDKYKVATPVNWRSGEDVIIIPAVNDEDAKKMFKDGWRAPRPYLRITKQPD